MWDRRTVLPALHEAMRRALVAGLTVLIAGCAGSPATAPVAARPAISVCLVTSANAADAELNRLAATGARAASVTLTVVESTQAAAYVPNLQQCAAAGPDLTVAVGAGLAGPLWSVANAHSSLRFALVDALPVDDQGQVAAVPNVMDVLFKEQESGYLAGVLAGLMENLKVGTAVHNRVGALGTTQSPSSSRYLAGFVAGVHSVSPAVSVKLDWTGLAEQAGCKDLGRAQIRSQADILFQAAGTCGAGYIEAAYEGRAYAIGSDTDQAGLSPAVITSALKRVDRALRLTVQRVAGGGFAAGPQYFGLMDETTGLAQPSSVVPQSILIRLATVQAGILSGSVIPPTDVPPAG